MSGRRLAVLALLVTLVLAGGLSYYASGHPDGLERVAETTGFADTAEDSATADSPLADYQTRGVGDERVSGGLAGLVGVTAVLAISGGLFWVLRRRGDRAGDEDRSTPVDAGR